MNEQIINMVVGALQSKLGVDADKIKAGVSALFSNGFDIQKLVSSFSGGDLGSIISSWIGSGSNKSIDANGIKQLFGEDKLKEFASHVGVDEHKAADALKDVVPDVVDKMTPDGDDILSQLGGLGDIAKKLF
jgi:uncharacterized protein YidB (DUF937 family)